MVLTVKSLIWLTVFFHIYSSQSTYSSTEFLWSRKLPNNQHSNFSLLSWFSLGFFSQLTNHENSWSFISDKIFSNNEGPSQNQMAVAISKKETRKSLIHETLRPQMISPTQSEALETWGIRLPSLPMKQVKILDSVAKGYFKILITHEIAITTSLCGFWAWLSSLYQVQQILVHLRFTRAHYITQQKS